MANARVIPLNWADSADLVASSEAAGMEVENTQLTLRSKFWRTLGAGAQTLDGEWGGDGRKVNAFGLFRHNTHGGTVRLQLYSDSAWTTGIYDSTALTVPSTALGDFDWGSDPLGTTSNDPLIYESPYVLWIGATYTAASFRITLGGTPANGDGYWQIGRVWLGKYWELNANMAPGMTIGWVQDAERRRSRSGSLRTSSGAARWRALAMDLRAINESDRATWMDAMAQVGYEKDVVFSAFPGIGGRQERDYVINGRFASLDAIDYQYAFKSKRVVIEEN